MKIYKGERTEEGCKVTVDGRELNPRLDLWKHSPSGFEWGYGGSGPAQLALALASNALGRGKANDELAVRVHQTVKATVVCRLHQDGWTLTEKDVKAAIAEAHMERHAREIRRNETTE